MRFGCNLFSGNQSSPEYILLLLHQPEALLASTIYITHDQSTDLSLKHTVYQEIHVKKHLRFHILLVIWKFFLADLLVFALKLLSFTNIFLLTCFLFSNHNFFCMNFPLYSPTEHPFSYWYHNSYGKLHSNYHNVYSCVATWTKVT